MGERTELDEFASLMGRPGTGAEEAIDPAKMVAGALEFTIDNMNSYTDDQIAALYEHLVSEISVRGLDEQIMGEIPDAAGINLDEEMNEMIKLVRRMRGNLSRQAALGKAVSNRELRETLVACSTTMKSLVSHQKSVRTMERQRVLESSLIEVLGTMDQAKQIEFQSLLRERLEELSD